MLKNITLSLLIVSLLSILVQPAVASLLSFTTPMHNTETSSELISPLLYACLLLTPSLLLIFNPFGHDVFLLPKWLFFIFLALLSWNLFTLRLVFSDSLPFLSCSFLISLALFLFSTLLSTLISLHPPSSASFLGKVLAGTILALICSSLSLKQKENFLKTYALFSLPVSLYAHLQKLHYDFILWNDLSVFSRPASSSGNPVFMGATLAPALLIFWHWATSLRGLWILPPCLGFSFSLSALSLSLSRAAYLAFAVAALLYFFSENRKKKLFVFLLAFLFFLPSAFFLGRTPVPIHGQGSVTPLSRIRKPALSNKVRLVLWRDTARLIQDRPFFGWGAGIFPLFYPQHRGVEILRWQSITALPEDAHNLFFQIASTQGFFGLFALSFLIAFFFFSLPPHPQKGFWLPLFCTLLIPPLFQPWNPEIFSLFFIALALPQKAKKISFSFLPRYKYELFFLHVLALFHILPLLVRPLFSDVAYKKALTYKAQEKYGKAVFALLKAIDTNPENLDARRELARAYRQAFLNKKEEKFLKEAIRLYRELLQQMPFDASLYAELGLTYSSYSEKKAYQKKALAAYHKAITMDPEFAIFHNDLGVLYLNIGLYKKARESLYRALQLVPDYYEPYKNLSIVFHRMKKNDVALRYGKMALEKEKNDSDLYAQLALLLEINHQHQEAVAMAKRAYKIQPRPEYRALLSRLGQ